MGNQLDEAWMTGKGAWRWVGRLVLIAAAITGSVGASSIIAAYAMKWAQAPLVAKIDDLTEWTRVNWQYISINTQRLDALEILRTAAPGSAAYVAAENDLLELARQRRRLTGIREGPK